jgi:hypothetical protein
MAYSSRALTAKLLLSGGMVFAAGGFAHAGPLRSELFVDGKADTVLRAGEPAKLQFSFTDGETGKMPHHFHEMHAKPMHLIIVSEDLSTFAHVHPSEKHHSKRPFELTVNTSTNDPDNFQLASAMPVSGKYFLFGEVMPMNYGMLLFSYDARAEGPARELAPLVADAVESDGSIVKYFAADGAAVARSSEARYRTKLTLEPVDHCNTVLPKLYIELSENVGDNFVPVTDLDTWLESYAHAIVVGAAGGSATTKIIQHLHAVWPLPTGDPSQDERGPYLELLAHSHGQSTPTDRYRSWVQIKHRGQVLTLSYTFDWKLEKMRPRKLRC